ncbi:hypothetical protein [Escherichia coli]|uniref:hypothetical protein n=1 Tax=Escherichia coli TaxID=562 RepID=UPI00191B3A14|nr:hypothetical protein [Escherichia coli]CAD6040665.1 Uncharacterised protein [Escherichia coli]CAD6090676.1 Uncharacterised protein [Escherichia coli]CAD6122373.1 Uncharacterised protein [Escherichia coli]
MKIEYRNDGEESSLIITSWIFERGWHNRFVDEVLFGVPGLRAESRGFFRRTTVISGAMPCIWCAEVIAGESGVEVRREAAQ